MCQSVASFYACNCAAENYLQRCKFPSLKCVENLQEPTAVRLGVPCLKHKLKFEREATTASQKNKNPYYPPTSFTKKVERGLSNSQLSRRLSNRSTVPPRTQASENNVGRRLSTSSSIYSDESVAPSIRSRSVRSRADSYAKLLDLEPLSYEQSTSLAEAQATLRQSILLDKQRRASEAEVFDNEIIPILSRQPSQRIKRTILDVTERRNLQLQPSNVNDILSPRTADTHPALRDQLSPRPNNIHSALHNPLTLQAEIPRPLSPTTIVRNASIKEKAARIRASFERERELITDLERRSASVTVSSARRPVSPIKKREYKSWTTRPSHTRAERNADRLVQALASTSQRPSRYEGILEDDVEAIRYLTDREKYELFLEKDRRKTALERQRRAERRARGGFVGELRDKSDGLCIVT